MQAPKARATQMPQESPSKMRKEEKPRGRSQPSRRTETKALEAESGGLPVGTPVKARKTSKAPGRKVPPKAEQSKERPAPKTLGKVQDPKEEIEIKIDQVDLGSSTRTNELMTTFGDELSFTNEPVPKVIESSPELKTLEVPLPSDQRAAFGQKVYSFQDELDICHKMERGWSTLQAAPAVPAPPNPYDFQKPLKGKWNSEGAVTKDGQASRTPNTHVRFPRLAELLRSGKAMDRSQRPVPEYGELTCLMQAQMVLGHSWTSDASVFSVALHWLQWFLPYIALVSVLLVVGLVVLGPSEAFFGLLPLPLLLPLQYLRCKTWNRQLLAAIDKAAFADAFDQLRAPLGWGEDGQVFSANLNAAMQALSLPPGDLLTSMRSRFDWRLAVLYPLVLVLPALYILKNETQSLEAAEVPVLLLCAFTMLAACSPGKEMRRSDLVDQRLEALETAFNALLDTLRPLLGSAAQPHCMQGKVGTSSSMGVERFSVRMVTSERFTLRGTLTISQEECSLQISCPLASFNLVANGLEGAVQTELGRCAAGEVDAMMMSPPRQGTSWAASLGMRFSRASPDTRARRDDDLASVSTASTLTRGKNQVDEASLHLALAMVTALNRRHAEPLEVFFAKTGVVMAPPKAAYDEPALVLALAEDQLTCYAGFGAFGPEMRSGPKGGCFGKGAAITKDSFGVVRDPSEMRQLCTDEEQGPLGRSTSLNLNMDESPRSYAASQGSDSEDEGAVVNGRPQPGATAVMPSFFQLHLDTWRWSSIPSRPGTGVLK